MPSVIILGSEGEGIYREGARSSGIDSLELSFDYVDGARDPSKSYAKSGTGNSCRQLGKWIYLPSKPEFES
jgi:hypothetical protein